jgi:hypothetical protein
MPLNMPVGYGIALFRFGLLDDPEEMVVTMGFDSTGGVIPSGNVLAENLADAWVTGTSAAQMDTPWRFIGTTLRINEGGGALAVYEHIEGLQGTWAGNSLPNNCALLVRKMTAQAGRLGKGRMYVPPFSVAETNVDQRGNLAGSTIANFQTQMNNFFTAFEAVVPAVLLHTYPPGGVGLAPTPILNLALQPKIATRRLRMRP